MILTGWRRGEVLGLRWSEIDLPRRTARLADTKTGASIRPLSELAFGDVVFASRSGETPIVGYRKMWLRIAKLGGLPADITPHVLRHSFASLAADLGYSEPTIASLLGHKTHSITSRYMHSAADAVANATMKLMASDQAQPQLRDQQRDGSVAWEGYSRYPTSATASAISPSGRFTSLLTALCESEPDVGVGRHPGRLCQTRVRYTLECAVGISHRKCRLSGDCCSLEKATGAPARSLM